MLDRMFPSKAEGGASKEAGPSSVNGDVGLVGVTEGGVVTWGGGVEPVEGGVKARGRSLRPGLFRGGAVGERVRLA